MLLSAAVVAVLVPTLTATKCLVVELAVIDLMSLAKCRVEDFLPKCP
jgi:hypothetical protein